MNPFVRRSDVMSVVDIVMEIERRLGVSGNDSALMLAHAYGSDDTLACYKVSDKSLLAAYVGRGMPIIADQNAEAAYLKDDAAKMIESICEYVTHGTFESSVGSFLEAKFEDLPLLVQLRVSKDTFPGIWNSLSALQRAQLTADIDASSGPKVDAAFARYCAQRAAQKEIQRIEAMPTSTPLERESQQRQLADERAKLASIGSVSGEPPSLAASDGPAGLDKAARKVLGLRVYRESKAKKFRDYASRAARAAGVDVKTINNWVRNEKEGSKDAAGKKKRSGVKLGGSAVHNILQGLGSLPRSSRK